MTNEWEYKIVELKSEMEVEEEKVSKLPKRWFRIPNVEDLLNKYGSEGWELVNFETIIDVKSDDFLFISVFKRMKK
ncbi:DUF4177 domain-containing protein [Candidatus Bathyarchaeota archaeon]|nr:DUF4177 domain-containing protein [Candidatus Bathyarchaeota archaeon]